MLTASPALAASSGSATVSGGIDAAAIPGAKVFGTTQANTPETVSFIFRAENLSQLEAKVQSGFSPYLSVSQFASTYGQPKRTVRTLQSYLAGYGIATTAYSNNLDVVANGTAGEFDKALSVTQQQYRTPAAASKSGGRSIPAQTFHGTTKSPSLPASIASQLLAVLGLTNYAPGVTNTTHVNPKVAQLGKAASSTSSNACLQASGLPDDCNLPSDFAADYGLDPLYADGAAGQGQTLGIVTLATVDSVPNSSKPAPTYFWRNVLHLRRSGKVTYENIDGGSGVPSWDAGSVETDIDVEESGALAPASNIVVYQAPNDDSGFIDGFFTAATQDVAGSVSCSWGEAETLIQSEVAQGMETPSYAAAFDEALLELAAQGQASFVASGDSGAYDAYGEFPGTDQPTNLSVDNPSDSPYTTAAGGTTLPFSADLGPSADGTTSDVTITVPQQRMWGWDYLWNAVSEVTGTDLLTTAESFIAGDGGGFSQFEAQPSYQRGVPGTSTFTAVPWLTPTDYTDEYGLPLPISWAINPNPGVVFGRGSGRAMPDLATNNDPNTGYEVYAPSAVGNEGITTPVFDGLGGTSFAAPQLNASTSVIDSLLGRRVGFWNPSIYKFATGANSPFTPLGTPGQTNDNLYYSGTPGALFDAGGGLGIPNLSTLAFDFGSGGH
ncbi:MAG TPA: S53 family peptidase [Solirubrobacteraceae bacterium]|jgi:subtilase family serine protease|nr:S53 family peptidase [Solirubrobacteraceae bacterium]